MRTRRIQVIVSTVLLLGPAAALVPAASAASPSVSSSGSKELTVRSSEQLAEALLAAARSASVTPSPTLGPPSSAPLAVPGAFHSIVQDGVTIKYLVGNLPAPSSEPTPTPSSTSFMQPAAVTPDYNSGSCTAYPANGLCLWTDAGFGGSNFMYYNTNSYTHEKFYPVGKGQSGASINDQASSEYNKRTTGTILGKNYPTSNNDNDCQPANTDVNNFQDYTWADGTSENDSISEFDLLNEAC